MRKALLLVATVATAALLLMTVPGRADEKKGKAKQELDRLVARAERLQAKLDAADEESARQIENEWNALVGDVKTWASSHGVSLASRSVPQPVSAGRPQTRCRRYTSGGGVQCFLTEMRTQGKVVVCLYECTSEIPAVRDQPADKGKSGKTKA